MGSLFRVIFIFLRIVRDLSSAKELNCSKCNSSKRLLRVHKSEYDELYRGECFSLLFYIVYAAQKLIIAQNVYLLSFSFEK